MTLGSSYDYRKALDDFRQARQQAALQEIMARLTGKSVELLAYETVAQQLRTTGSAGRGLQEIPLDAIVGSVGRYHDFTRTFLPRHDSDQERWANVKAYATGSGSSGPPPIDVYKVGEAYFVVDGHHRVSIARQMGATQIEAYVTEIRTKVPLTPDVRPDDLIAMAEYAGFLEATRLDQLRPNADLRVTECGQYAKLLTYIDAHHAAMEAEQDREVSDEAAVIDWYDHVYQPVVLAFQDQGLLRHFPGRTETDLYVWVAEHRAALEEELGWQVRPEAAAMALAAGVRPRRNIVARVSTGILKAMGETGPPPGEWRKEKLTARYADRLFADILVPLNGQEASWAALDQALEVAQREGARLHGLHVVAAEAEKETEAAQALRAEFNRRCTAVGLTGLLAVEVGEIALKICERGLLADLVVLNLAYPPPSQPLARLDSGFRTIIRRCARPILAVPGAPYPLDRVLLAYDGSPKAQEALFVATYFAEVWDVPLVVVVVAEAELAPEAALNRAREYLDFHEIEATFVSESGPVAEAVLRTAEAHDSRMITIGSYSAHPVLEVMLGSSVDQVLRQSHCPVLICR